jgi:hypothetical protein
MQSPAAGSSVRCLGWENLRMPLDILSSAVAQTLTMLDVPYSITMRITDHATAFIAQPQQPMQQPPSLSTSLADISLGGTCSRLDGEPPLPPSPFLRVALQIFKAEAPDSFHVRIRRLQGGHWRFLAFYQAFRSIYAQRLGLPDERQLSVHSPMQPKRDAESAPVLGWGRNPMQPTQFPIAEAMEEADCPMQSRSSSNHSISQPSPGRRCGPSPSSSRGFNVWPATSPGPGNASGGSCSRGSSRGSSRGGSFKSDAGGSFQRRANARMALGAGADLLSSRAHHTSALSAAMRSPSMSPMQGSPWGSPLQTHNRFSR